MDFAAKVLSSKVEKGKIKLIFMGQAGFIIKDDKGRLIAIDLYLSDCCERYFGFKRLMPKLISAIDLKFDVVITTHAHYDHFDPDSIPQMVNRSTDFYTSEGGIPECERLGMRTDNISVLKVGNSYKNGDMTIHAVYCNHGELAPDAVGIVIELAGKKLYFVGDTSYNPDQLNCELTRNVDFMAVPVNGAFGNLNEQESVLLAKHLNAKLVVPCHFWNFAEHLGNPYLFLDNAKKSLAGGSYRLMSMGEEISL